MRRYTLFGSPSGYEPASRSYGQRSVVMDPTRGFNGGTPPQKLTPGYTPDSRNMVSDAGWIRQRSGLSQFGIPLSSEAIGGGEVFDVNGGAHAFVGSDTSLAYYYDVSTGWSDLSYLTGGVGDAPSGTSRSYWQHANIYDPGTDQNIVVLTNDLQSPKYFYQLSSTNTYSDFSFIDSQFSAAKVVTAFDNRLVWANLSGSDFNYPQRVLWSARGNPNGYAIGTDGSGFQDLLDATGEIRRVVPFENYIIVFFDEEVWIGQKRGDAYVFEFLAVMKDIGGAHENTIVSTPLGIIFYGRDNEVYLMRGAELTPLGPARAGLPSRIQAHLRTNVADGTRAWGLYNSKYHRYELYYPSYGSASGHCDRALYFNLDTGSWFEQRFPYEVSWGFEFRDPGVSVTWDDLNVTWDSLNVTWDGIGGGSSIVYDPLVVGSGGTAYRLRSNTTNDDGSDMDVRWRSHGLGTEDFMQYDQLYEVWLEYAADSASSASVFVSNNMGVSWEDGIALNLGASDASVAHAPIYSTGYSPVYEIRMNDGYGVKFSRMEAHLRPGGMWHGRL